MNKLVSIESFMILKTLVTSIVEFYETHETQEVLNFAVCMNLG